jgi:hypothetical protein
MRMAGLTDNKLALFCSHFRYASDQIADLIVVQKACMGRGVGSDMHVEMAF